MFEPIEQENIKTCCGEKNDPIMKMQKENNKLDEFQKLLFDRVTVRRKGMRAWRKVQLTYNLRKLMEEKPLNDPDVPDDDVEEEAGCCSLKELEKLVIMPNNNFKVIVDIVINIVYLVNIMISTSVIAFYMHNFEYLYKYEYIFDCIVFIYMFLTFFTAFEIKTGDESKIVYCK